MKREHKYATIAAFILAVTGVVTLSSMQDVTEASGKLATPPWAALEAVQEVSRTRALPATIQFSEEKNGPTQAVFTFSSGTDLRISPEKMGNRKIRHIWALATGGDAEFRAHLDDSALLDTDVQLKSGEYWSKGFRHAHGDRTLRVGAGSIESGNTVMVVVTLW